jgi:hypothetical protein
LTASPGGGSFGLSVLLREGVAAWMAHGAASLPPASSTAPDAVSNSAIASPLHAGIVQILASIALNRMEDIHS